MSLCIFAECGKDDIVNDLQNWNTDIHEAVAKGEYAAAKLLAELHLSNSQDALIVISWKRFQSRTWSSKDICCVCVTFHVEHNPNQKYTVFVTMSRFWDPTKEHYVWQPNRAIGKVPGDQDGMPSVGDFRYKGENQPLEIKIAFESAPHYPYINR